jgi:formate/nitrite transporter
MNEEKLTSASGFDAYAPAEIARRVQYAGLAKVRQRVSTTFVLAVLAGAYISFGVVSYTIAIAITDSTLGSGPTRLLGGVAFSLGLVLVIVAGAELFTGNALIVIGWADRKVRTAELLRNWAVVYGGNLVGALGTASLVVLSGILELHSGAVGSEAAAIAYGKLQLAYVDAFFRGVLCNVLVCLAVWLSFAARGITDKVLAIVFPVSAFVVAGFEHSVANMYAIPVTFMAGLIKHDWPGLLVNLAMVSAGNIVGGGVLVALVYWAVYILQWTRPKTANDIGMWK